jgi:hypothetical protein
VNLIVGRDRHAKQSVAPANRVRDLGFAQPPGRAIERGLGGSAEAKDCVGAVEIVQRVRAAEGNSVESYDPEI